MGSPDAESGRWHFVPPFSGLSTPAGSWAETDQTQGDEPDGHINLTKVWVLPDHGHTWQQSSRLPSLPKSVT